MKKTATICFLMIISFPSHAGFLSGFFSSAAANIVTSDSSGGVRQSDLEKINSYLWGMVKSNNYIQEYEFYTQLLEEQSNDPGYLDTVAHVYFNNGEKEKAKQLYETRVLPYKRYDQSYVNQYRIFAELSDEDKIDYADIYVKAEEYRESRKVEQTGSGSLEFLLWLILITLLANTFISYKSAKKASTI
ncbi:MAG: hypothetical protein OQL20_01585 [Sedimenticola sp.]|nr:hypothetical protein [Sedimenticola sp.]